MTGSYSAEGSLSETEEINGLKPLTNTCGASEPEEINLREA